MIDSTGLIIDLLGGISIGMIYFLVAAGFSVIFGVLGIMNFAHGTFYLLAAYILCSILEVLQGSMGGFWIGIAAATTAVGALAIPIEMLLFRRIYKSEHLYQVLLTFGLVLFLQGSILQVWGGGFRTISLPPALTGSVMIGDRSFPVYYVFVLVASLVVGAGLWFFLYHTRLGKLTRAAAMDREISEALGINVPKIFTVVFCMGIMLVGLGAGLGGSLRTLTVEADLDVLLVCFIVVIIGGVGSLQGALIAALVLGVLESFAGHYFQELGMVIPYVLLVTVLLWRPQGLFGRR
jgi:branched-chain amino acid transport system permease protein